MSARTVVLRLSAVSARADITVVRICAVQTSRDPVQKGARMMDQAKPTHLPQQANQTARQPASDTGTSLNPSAPPFTSASNLTMADQPVLLQTALTSIYDPTKPQSDVEKMDL